MHDLQQVFDAAQVALLAQRLAHIRLAAYELDLVTPRPRRLDSAGYGRPGRVVAAHGIERNPDHVSCGIIDESAMGVLNTVRANADRIAGNGRFVTINRTAIEAYAVSLAQARAPELDAATHFIGEAADTLAYVVTLDAINFGSGYFPHLRKRPGMSGYFTVASSLKDQWLASGPWSAAALTSVTAERCARVFGQAPVADPVVAELMDLFATALNQLGALLTARFGGDFGALVGAADGSAEQLVEILVEMPFYRDVGFYKRAQLTAADLALAGVAEFRDLDRLTIFADNLVPHVLRVDGVLSYDSGLLARINRAELISPGSTEEVEIRGTALHAVELIRRALGDVTSMQLDYLLWNRGQQPAYKSLPRHRTRTVFY
jgi:hypothetical protein